ncbi:hypothetical protein EVAR_59876_1 [Eumeta japonica]|uniref:Uncharacterized protein n=1 Tax=Eumeta variegata TaxID=151549 RepID=A0A4C1XNL0_EUMVA|nr:hypothetical protein EVAR_59876_1 [Eumeta japonica]
MPRTTGGCIYISEPHACPRSSIILCLFENRRFDAGARRPQMMTYTSFRSARSYPYSIKGTRAFEIQEPPPLLALNIHEYRDDTFTKFIRTTSSAEITCRCVPG